MSQEFAPIEQPPVNVRKRSGCLTAFLALAIVGNPLLALFTWAMASDAPASMQSALVFGGLLNMACLGFAIAIWQWKRWGVYGYVISLGLFILLNFATGDIALGLRGLIPIAILIALVNPIWGQMD